MAITVDFEEFEDIKADDYIVKDEQVASAEKSMFVNPKSIDPETERAEATNLVKHVSTSPAKSMEFSEIVSAVENYGSSAIKKAAEGSNSILQRSTTSLNGSKKNGSSNQVVVANTLGELRDIVDDLSPRSGDLSPVKKILGFIPGSNKVQKYFRKYESAQGQLDGIIKGLEGGRDSLLRDNAEIKTERKHMLGAIQSLAKTKRVMDQMHTAVSAEVSKLEDSGDIDQANAVKSDVLFAVNQRRQDIATQFAVSAQAYMSLELIEKNNKELIKGVERAQSVTMVALRNAVLVAEALEGQKLVLDKIESLNSTTNALIDHNSKMLQDNTVRIHTQASQSTIDPAVLERSFKAIEDTMQAIDTHKANANVAMEATTARLTEQIDNAKVRIQRSIENQHNEERSSSGALGK